MTKKRDHTRYELYDGNTKVYVGITNDPERREAEHANDGKDFTRMNIVGPKVSKDTALDWEQETIDGYKKGHKGKGPKYNEQ